MTAISAAVVAAFLLGTMIAVWLNVCIERLPWEQSPLWPRMRLPNSTEPLPRWGRVPIVGWLAMRLQGHLVPARWLTVQVLTGSLFALDFWAFPEDHWGARIYRFALIAILTTATFTDIDHQVIPSPITDLGMVAGMLGAALAPWARLEPERAATVWEGVQLGGIGLMSGAGVVLATRLLGAVLFRREAMGMGDVGLMAVIGSFLGWRIAILTFFLAAFIGLFHAGLKLIVVLGKLIARRKILASDREMFFGPYLCAAAWILMIGWPKIWNGYAKDLFESLSVLFGHYIMGYELTP